MLLELFISNFILIDELRMHFADGLNILSGETGAGKSIILDAMGLLMGDRVSYDDIRDPSKKAVVEGVFDISRNPGISEYLEEQGLEDNEGTLLVSRELYSQGRTIARVNSRTVSASVLKSLGLQLIELHGQDDRQNALSPAKYQSYVDSFISGGTNILQETAAAFRALHEAQKDLEALLKNAKDREQRLEMLLFQINEIDQSNLYPGEDSELEELRDRIRNARHLLEGSNKILSLLSSANEAEAACDQIYQAAETAKTLNADPFFSGILNPLEEIYYQLQDLSEQVLSFREKLDFEPGILEATEDRLYEIKRLKKKYGGTIEEIHSFQAAAQKDWEELNHCEENQEKLQQKIETLKNSYEAICAELHEKRVESAAKLEHRVHDELIDLNMPHLQFRVEITKTHLPGLTGLDEVEFLFSPNPGEDLRPLAKIASGGEISRFILALKIALADVYDVPTLIFDEIDTGIGGSTLTAMAKKMAALSKNHQLILITHSPQISCYAEQHFSIEKVVENQKTYTKVRVLKQEERVYEIARMLDGDHYTSMAVQHAKEMLRKAGQEAAGELDDSISLFDM